MAIGKQCLYLSIQCANVFTFNVAVLVIGIVLYLTSTSRYAAVITSETAEWSNPPIINVTSASMFNASQCPSGYELVTVDFPGTNDLCSKGTSYSIGRCGR
jgi:hypothetical protein